MPEPRDSLIDRLAYAQRDYLVDFVIRLWRGNCALRELIAEWEATINDEQISKSLGEDYVSCMRANLPDLQRIVELGQAVSPDV